MRERERGWVADAARACIFLWIFRERLAVWERCVARVEACVVELGFVPRDCEDSQRKNKSKEKGYTKRKLRFLGRFETL